MSLIAGGTVIALRAIFERPAPFPAGTVGEGVLSLVVPAITTALISPLVFLAVRRLESVSVRRREERAAT